MVFNPQAPGSAVLNALQASLSPERFATYLAAASGDRAEALRLYTWNTAWFRICSNQVTRARGNAGL